MTDKNEDFDNLSAGNVVRLIDSFIEQMRQTRKTMALTLSLAISSIVIAPVAIGLSIYLLQHPVFFSVLEKEHEFGLILGGLLIGVTLVSAIWFVVGIKQYRSIDSWNKKYNIYSKRKEELDRNISSQYGLDQDSLLMSFQYEETLSHRAPRFAAKILFLFVLIYMLSLILFRLKGESCLSTP